MADAELPHVQVGVSSSSTGCREGRPFSQNCRYAFVQRIRVPPADARACPTITHTDLRL